MLANRIIVSTSWQKCHHALRAKLRCLKASMSRQKKKCKYKKLTKLSVKAKCPTKRFGSWTLSRKEWTYSRCYTLKLLAETCVQRQREQVSQSGVTRWSSRFVTTAIVAIVAGVQSGSTFREACLATEVQNVSRNRPCNACWNMLRNAVAHQLVAWKDCHRGWFPLLPEHLLKKKKAEGRYQLCSLQMTLKW